MWNSGFMDEPIFPRQSGNGGDVIATTKGTIVFNCITVDGKNVIDVRQVDPEVDRLLVTTDKGEVYLFRLVTENGLKYVVLSLDESSTHGVDHALGVYQDVRSGAMPADALYFRAWDFGAKRHVHTPQPQIGQWLTLHVGVLSPAKKWGSEAIRHSMIGGHITNIESIEARVLQPC